VVALQYAYNMLQAPCRQVSVDSGTQRTLLDVAGQPLYAWDAENRKTEMLYDELRRPLKRITENKTLEQYIYGETLTNPKAGNYRGQVYQHKDGGGLQQINEYDFKGNPLQTQQQLLNDATLTDVDWGSSPALSTEVFTGSITYDALNRPVNTTDPGGNIQAFTYDKGGLLKTVALNDNSYVNDIHYDAKGQRQAIWYGNGTKTSYTYDPDTFRLRRLLTVNLSTNTQLQDLNYYYDPVGNITTIRDDAQQTLFFNNSVVSPTQTFTYDALYRLTAATGRELKGTASFGNEDNWNDAPWMGQPQPGNGSAVQNYTQHYTYDAVGNILSLQHVAGTGSYTRTYDVDTASNKLLSTTVGSNTYHYTHDTRGNMLTMPHLSSMAWNLNNELKIIVRGTNTTYYQYSGGQRIRKYTDKGSIKEERIYLGSYEIYRKFDHTSSLIIERTTVHISDDTGRIAMLEKRTYGTAADDNNTAATLTRYIYSNHLQSASLELDESAAIISYEEYHPYGTTSYQAMNASIKAVAKRYRYTGKERDEESGLYYHGARYYIPWLARWSASDPLESKFAGRTPYCYGANNPVKYNDPTGNEEYDSYEDYKKAKGDNALKQMDGSDGAWLKSDRIGKAENGRWIKGKNEVWSNAMAFITKNDKKGLLVGYHTELKYDENYNGGMGLYKDDYNFDIVRDYYNWVQHQVDLKGYSTQWAKGASYLVDELADTFQEGLGRGGVFTPKLGKLLNELNQEIANYAVGRFKEILYDGKLPTDTKEGWYNWDVDFIMREQVTEVAPRIYKAYEGTEELDLMNELSRKEGFLGTSASTLPGHFIPSFATFGFSINRKESYDNTGNPDWSDHFGALGRFNLPLMMLYPYTHGSKFKLSERQMGEILKASKAIQNYYNTKMKY